MGKTIAVSDASLGSQNRAAQVYILESRCEKYRIIGVAPIDCDDLLVELYNINSGSVDVYCGNKDSLAKQPIQSNKITFPRFYRPNVDLKI